MKRSNGALACMVNAELGAVLAVMRRNARWAAWYAAEDEDELDHSLLHSFRSLRRTIFTWQQQQPWHSIHPSLYLSPFLDAIHSEEAGAPITGIALSALYKILSVQVFDLETSHVQEAMHSIVKSVTSCRFQVTDAASEEVVLLKILQVLLACIKHSASRLLSDADVCLVVNTCFRVVHQAFTKGELLQRTSRHTMHEIIRAIFVRLPDLAPSPSLLQSNSPQIASAVNHVGTVKGADEGCAISSLTCNGTADTEDQESVTKETQAYGVTGVAEIFRYLCSLLSVVDSDKVSGKNVLPIDEDVPLFALGLINSAVELGGHSFACHFELIGLVQDDLFHYLLELGLSMNPLILSMVCSIVLNLYHHLRMHLKLQLEAFFSCVIIRLTQGKLGATYQQQEVAMEALVDFCRQPTFISEVYANFDCDISCSNIFEDLCSSLSKSAFPVNCPLSAMHVLALEGLIAIITGLAERGTLLPSILLPDSSNEVDVHEYKPLWILKGENYRDPNCWLEFIRQQKHIKQKLMIGVDQFNRDPKKGIEFLQGIHLLPEKLDPNSVACFFRYTTGLEKNLLGDFLGDPDDFCLGVLTEYTKLFDFEGMSLDAALRTFLEAFRLPGEAQKIERILDAFAVRYYEPSPLIFADKDAAFVLAYSLIILNTDLHSVQVKKKMTEDEFIKNNRKINRGQDLPRDYLSKLYHSIARNGIKMSYESGAGVSEMTPGRWAGLVCRCKKTPPYIVCDSSPFLDHDMFTIISSPTIAAISVVFEHAEDDEVSETCVNGFLAVAKISVNLHAKSVLDELVVCLCKMTTLLNPLASGEDPVTNFGNDNKARMATSCVFRITNELGDYIEHGWKSIIDCIVRLHKIGLLQAHVMGTSDDPDALDDSLHSKPVAIGPPMLPLASTGFKRRSAGLMGRFSQLLFLEADELRLQPTEEQLTSYQRSLQTLEACRIDNIFTESRLLQADSLLLLAKALILAAGGPLNVNNSSSEAEDVAVFCLDLLIAVTLNNRDRIMLLWEIVFEHITAIVQKTTVPCLLIEKAVFGLFCICQRLLPYKENLAEELLQALQLILKLDVRVADTYCERITREVLQLVRANARHIKSPLGWRTISSLLSISARHPEASEAGFEALSFIMSEAAHLTEANFPLCLDAAQAFAEARLGGFERSQIALDLMAGSIKYIVTLSNSAQVPTMTTGVREENRVMSEVLAKMWLKLTESLSKSLGDAREKVRSHALLCLQRILLAADSLHIHPSMWVQCFEQVIFPMLDNLLTIAVEYSPSEYRGMENTLHQAIKLASKTFLQCLHNLCGLPQFPTLWLALLSRMQRYMKEKIRGRKSDKLQELIPELLKNIILIMNTGGMLLDPSTLDDTLWKQTLVHVNEISPSLQAELFPETGPQSNLQLERATKTSPTMEPTESCISVVSAPFETSKTSDCTVAVE